ncbi:MAG: MBOAT family protein [Alphaproteobacteria bacterium]
MLFNSLEFLFLFLPVTLGAFLILKRLGFGRAALIFIALTSLFFYAWWDPRYLALLLASILFNFFIGGKLLAPSPPRALLVFGVGVNLAALGVFKYFNFLVGNINLLLAQDIVAPTIILPLGISFFTFQQIAYLVDAYNGKAQRPSFLEYITYISFFPHLIAGPIVHHATVIPQFRALPAKPYDWRGTAIGLTLFSMGLFKKVLLADTLAAHGSPVFDAALNGTAITFADGWMGALAYTLQLYFDFSGYSDMAIGLGLMFGIRLPDNFFSPHKATNIIDFWRRWHITLSAFLRNYLYIPLGGNRRGETRRYTNLMITMLLGGLWHGANWTFVLWGGLHGLYLVINNVWRHAFPGLLAQNRAGKILSWFITFLAVVVAWVIFRCENVTAAANMLGGMAGLNGAGAWKDGDAAEIIAIGLAIALLMPNAMQIIAFAESGGEKKWYSWVPDKKWLAATIFLLGVALYYAVYTMNRISEFIYFQF